LTAGNHEAYKTEIPWSRLPCTIHDAVIATRLLDLKYIWVDSLCIIQDGDDGKDKESQLGRMADVYTYADLTIMAKGAKAADEHFFGERSLPFGTSFLPFQLSNGPCARVTWTPDSALQDLQETDMTALDTQGWVLQEHVLSHRLIRFGT